MSGKKKRVLKKKSGLFKTGKGRMGKDLVMERNQFRSLKKKLLNACSNIQECAKDGEK